MGDVLDRAGALDDIVAGPAEDLVVAAAPGDVVVAVAARSLVEVLDLPGSPRGDVAVRVAVVLRNSADHHLPRKGVVNLRPSQHLEARIGDVVDGIGDGPRETVAQPGGSADNQVVAAAAADGIVAGAADQDVLAVAALDKIVAAQRQVARVNPGRFDDLARGEIAVAAGPQRSDHLAGRRIDELDTAEVAQDDIAA